MIEFNSNTQKPLLRPSLCLSILAIIIPNNVTSQNLVPNPSFDNYSSCPYGVSNLNLANSWSNLGASSGTPDYYNTCSGAYSPVTIPQNFAGYQWPNSGNGYAGLYTYGGPNYNNIPPSITDYREYITTQLISSMVIGETYQVSFKYSSGEEMRFASDGLGVLFDTSPISSNNNNVYTASSPQIANPSGNILATTNGWTTVTVNLIATSAWEYICLGSFRTDVATNTAVNNIDIYSRAYAYLYIDDVSVVRVTPLPIELVNFNAQLKDLDIVELNWETSAEINNDYFTLERSQDGVSFETIGTVTGNGNSSITSHYEWKDDQPYEGLSYYRLKQTDFNGASSYHGIKTITREGIKKASIYPNPFKHAFTIELSENTAYPIQVEVMDYLGRKVHEQTLENRATEIELSNSLSVGTYFVKVFNETSQVVDRIVKTK